jgi:hypothetical protein
MFDTRRREFITLLGGAAVTWPLVAQAQQPAMPVIGFLVAGTPLSHGQWVAAFVQRLRELGWIEGRTIAIEYRWGEGRNERFAEIAAEFVRRKVDVIVTSATAAVVAAKQAGVGGAGRRAAYALENPAFPHDKDLESVFWRGTVRKLPRAGQLRGHGTRPQSRLCCDE